MTRDSRRHQREHHHGGLTFEERGATKDAGEQVGARAEVEDEVDGVSILVGSMDVDNVGVFDGGEPMDLGLSKGKITVEGFKGKGLIDKFDSELLTKGQRGMIHHAQSRLSKPH